MIEIEEQKKEEALNKIKEHDLNLRKIRDKQAWDLKMKLEINRLKQEDKKEEI